MRSDHREVFKSVATREKCWIGLREPNPLGDKWIGSVQSLPKPVTCKAKTATNSMHEYGGLVVSPLLCPEAFTVTTKANAIKKWNGSSFAGTHLPAGFTVSGSGLVKINGACIHPDYDLMSVVSADSRGEMIFTPQSESEKLFAGVQWEINGDLGIDMIQHGSEFMWKGGIGAADFEYVLWFGPNGKFRRCPSSNQITSRAGASKS